MARWTPTEISALRSTVGYEAFASATGGSKTYDAWEVKRRRVDPVGTVVALSPMQLQRAVANNIKLARQVIRMRHSIEADDELFDVIPRIRGILTEQAQSGQVTGVSYDELRALIYG